MVRLAFALKGVDTEPFVRKLTAVDGVPENRCDTSLAVSVSLRVRALPCSNNATFCDGSTIYLDLSLALSSSHITLANPNHHTFAQILNPQQSTPFMELADGSVVAESVSMVQYIDALYPGGGSTGQNALLRTPSRLPSMLHARKQHEHARAARCARVICHSRARALSLGSLLR